MHGEKPCSALNLFVLCFNLDESNYSVYYIINIKPYKVENTLCNLKVNLRNAGRRGIRHDKYTSKIKLTYEGVWKWQMKKD